MGFIILKPVKISISKRFYPGGNKDPSKKVITEIAKKVEISTSMSPFNDKTQSKIDLNSFKSFSQPPKQICEEPFDKLHSDYSKQPSTNSINPNAADDYGNVISPINCKKTLIVDNYGEHVPNPKKVVSL